MSTFKRRFEKAVQDAQTSFWCTIAEQFPEVKRGDYPPYDDFKFGSACEKAVTTWLDVNDFPKALDEVSEKEAAEFIASMLPGATVVKKDSNT